MAHTPQTGDLCLLADVKAYLSTDPSNPMTNVNDDLLQRMITAASAFIQSYISRTIKAADYTATMNGNGNCMMLLPNTPVNSVASVTVDGQAIGPRTDPQGAGWFLANNAVWLAGYRFTRALGNVVIAYNAGYSSTPQVIEDVCIELVGRRYMRRERLGQNSKILAGETVSYEPSDLSPEMKRTLQQWSKVVPIA